MSRFLHERSQLLIISDSGAVVWKGNPKNWPIAKIVEVPNVDSAIVLFDYYKWNTSRGFNLICVYSCGIMLWEATEISGQLSGELITEIQVEDGRYLVNTWNGFHLHVDEKDGRMVVLNFTK